MLKEYKAKNLIKGNKVKEIFREVMTVEKQ